MKHHVNSFQQFINEAKAYGEEISAEKFGKLKKGSEIIYRGSTCTVVDANEHTITVKNSKGKERKINRNMFNENGMIR